MINRDLDKLLKWEFNKNIVLGEKNINDVYERRYRIKANNMKNNIISFYVRTTDYDMNGKYTGFSNEHLVTLDISKHKNANINDLIFYVINKANPILMMKCNIKATDIKDLGGK